MQVGAQAGEIGPGGRGALHVFVDQPVDLAKLGLLFGPDRSGEIIVE